MGRVRNFRSILIALFSLALFACGGGGSDMGASAAGAAGQGVAVDPYVVGAVFEEVSASGEVIQTSAASDESGRFGFSAPLTPGSLLRLKAGAKGLHNNRPFEGALRRLVDEDGSLVVSPLTTLVADGMSPQEVIEVLSAAGIDGVSVDSLDRDPMEVLSSSDLGNVSDADLKLLQAARAVNSLLVLKGGTLGASVDSGTVDLLGELGSVVRQTLSRDALAQVAQSVQAIAGLDLHDLIAASVSMTDSIVDAVRTAPSSQGVSQAAAARLPLMADAALAHYVQHRSNDVNVQAAVNAGRLPRVAATDIIVVEGTGIRTNARPAPAAVANGPDGAALYANNCIACHRTLASSTKKNRTAAGIRAAISANIGGMSYLARLSDAEIQAIAAALATSTPPAADGATGAGTDTGTGSADPGTGTGSALNGSMLYADNCADCHGSVTSSTKKNRSASAISSAISGNFGGMGFLSGLSAEQIRAIADSLATSAPTTPPSTGSDAATPPNGGALYANRCAGCHGPLSTSAKAGATAADIGWSIANISIMAGLSDLSAEEIQAIADVLPAAAPPVIGEPVTDGAVLYAERCAGCHGALATSAKAGATAADITSAIGDFAAMGGLGDLSAEQIAAIAEVLPAPAPAPEPGAPADGAALYASRCASCHGALENSAKAGATAADIDTAISGITAMASLGDLNAEQIAAIVSVLLSAPQGDGTPAPVSCDSCHGQPPAVGAHFAHIDLPAISGDCSVCHLGAGGGSALHQNGVADVSIDGLFNARSGAASFNATAKTCSNLSCHGGQTTPNWTTGTLSATSCTSCHQRGTSQYNSYNSGEHSKHVSSEGISCTACHNTTLLSIGHFAGLETSGFEQSPGSTIGGGGTRLSAGAYNSSTKNCARACHGSESWR